MEGGRKTKMRRRKRCGKVRIVIKCFIAFIYGDYLTVLLVLYTILILGSGAPYVMVVLGAFRQPGSLDVT